MDARPATADGAGNRQGGSSMGEMADDPRVAKMAEVLVRYSLDVQPGWQVCIAAPPLAAPLITAVYREILRAGGLPSTHLSLPGLEDVLLQEGKDAQVEYQAPLARILWDEFDALLTIGAASGGGPDRPIAPARIALRQQAARRVSKAFAWREMGRPYCLTQYPTEAYATAAGMTLAEYTDFVYRACMLDQPDPIAAWGRLRALQQRLVDWLEGKDVVRVESPDVDLTFSIAGRSFTNSDGHHNFPSGEIFTGPVEDSVRGHIHFTYPAHYRGQDVTDVTLLFEAGQVARWEAGTGGEFLAAMLDLDAGARRLGEFAIGTNPGVDRFTRNVLFDEKMAGTIHCALGQSYPQTGGRNESALHWDMVTDMRAGRITVDGTPFYEGGRFLV